MKNDSILRVLKGVVIRKKSLKTVIVRIDKKILHPVYKKVIIRSTKLHVHDENDICKEGDIVSIKESSPYSKTKFWLFLQILNERV
ncbi:MAG: 30S ribosomal protein S17 [Candidatus Azosocius agrarius]|nr:MAG: 30S ribosomal protein S17 [Gammaproteobacteria bacterium]